MTGIRLFQTLLTQKQIVLLGALMISLASIRNSRANCPHSPYQLTPREKDQLSQIISRLEKEYPERKPAPVTVSLESLGFSCSAETPQEGRTCYGKIDGYPQKVAFIIPPGYQPTKQANLVLHLNGFNPPPKAPPTYSNALTIEQLVHKFGLARAFAKTHRNAILVVPLSTYVEKDYLSNLTPDKDTRKTFEAFIRKCVSILADAKLVREPTLANLAVTAHSGAYQPLVRILDSHSFNKQLREIYLIDALYRDHSTFERFAQDPSHRFWSCYLPHKYFFHGFSKTESENFAVMKSLQDQGIKYWSGETHPTQEEMTKSRIGFIKLNCPRGEPLLDCHFASVNRLFSRLVGSGAPK